MKKKHFVTLLFKNVYGQNYWFQGLVTGAVHQGKFVISATKLFRKAFGFELPDHTVINIY